PLAGVASATSATSFVATASHDTAAAVAGSLALRPDTAFISSGSWCLVGAEIEHPVINEQSRVANLSNELGADGRVRLLKNVIGLWLLGESRRHWRDQGIEMSHQDMVEAAARQEPLQHVFDPDDSSLLTPGDVPLRIAQLLGLPGELDPAPATRAIIDSLALKFRWVVDQVEEVSGVPMRRINLVGGGARNRVLCQATADATGRPVIAGPAEATALGNIIVQLVAHGDVASAAEGRELAARGADLRVYEPKDQARWAEVYEQFRLGIQARST
ncbi:MAG: FGGY-family carbohydrate kinase, partial [Chloroflexota bacterium]